MPERVLITGGAGFIGSHLADACLAAGHTVGVVDSFATGRRAYLPPDAEIYAAEITDPVGLSRAFEAFAPTVVSHHAGHINVRVSLQAPALDARVNLLGSLQVIEEATRAGVKHLYFSSTGGAIYGAAKVRPTPETAECSPESPYAIAKWAVEEYLRVLGKLHGLPVTVFRYANVYGPRQIVEGEAGVVAIFAEALLRGEAPTIYGTGHFTRDYVYVGDVIRAHMAALEHPVEGTYNIGTGIETSVLAIYDQVRSALGSDREPNRAAERPGEIIASSLDSTRASQVFGWTPTVGLAEGLGRTVDWFRSKAVR